MPQAKQGDLVKVHYTGTLDDGTVFDSSEDSEPLQFVIGEGMLIPAFEEGIVGMKPGESKSVHIAAIEAYGPYQDEMIIEVDRSEVPANLNLELGMQLQIGQEDGHSTVATVVKLTDEKVSLDANHPLAGKDLTFGLTLVEIIGR